MTLKIEDLYVDPELELLLPAASEDEMNRLAVDVGENGFRDAVAYWCNPEDGEPCVVDGHRRYRLWEASDRTDKPPTKAMRFPDRDAVKKWMLTHQLARRNATPDGRDKMVVALVELEKSRRKIAANTEENSAEPISANVALIAGKASEQVAKQTGIPARTIERAIASEKASTAIRSADPRFAEQLDAGDQKLSKTDRATLGRMKSEDMRAAIKQIRLGEPWKPKAKPRSQAAAAKKSATPATRTQQFKPLISAIGKAGRELTDLQKVVKDEFPAIEKRLDEAMNLAVKQRDKK